MPSDLPVRVQVFGGLRLWRHGAEVKLGVPRQRAVLTALVAAQGKSVAISELIDLVWGEQPSTSAVNQLHRLIGQVRRLFEPELASRSTGKWVQPAGTGYRLLVDRRTCDLIEFGELIRSARAAVAEGETQNAIRLFGRALDVAQEPVDSHHFPQTALVALERHRIEAAVAAADLALAEPPPAGYLSLLQRIAAFAPLHEPLQARLMRLLTAAGRRAEALSLFDDTRHRLADELGVDPGAELRAAHHDALVEDPAPAVTAAPTRPAQLPRRVVGFAGRGDLAVALDEHLAGVAAGDTDAIVVLSGMGGVGKTTLAVEWAHRVAASFPDGALYLNLRGFDPGGRLIHPADALGTLLTSVGVNLSSIGTDVDARAAQFRSAMSGRRMVVLLDNAYDSEQVRPLLPGTSGSLVIVTSRNRLTSLVAREGAHPAPVGRLGEDAAHELVGKRLGANRLTAEPQAVDQLVRLCAGLPLALSIAAARVAVNPLVPLARVVAELGSPQHRLDALTTNDADDDVRSTFSWSYAALSPAAARQFRLLAPHPASEISLASAASLAGTDLASTRSALAELSAANMVTEVANGRYTVHDLLQVYAGELLAADPDERQAAQTRLIGHYLHSARNAYRTFGRSAAVDLDPLPPGVLPEDTPDQTVAVDWYVRERAGLNGVIDLALRLGLPRQAALITFDLRPMRVVSAEPWSEAKEGILEILDAVAGLGEPALYAGMLREAANGCIVSDPDLFLAYVTEALDIYVDIGDLAGQSMAWRTLSRSRLLSTEEQAVMVRNAIDAARRFGEPALLALSLDALAAFLGDDAHRDEMAAVCEEALAIAVEHDLVDLQIDPAMRLSEIALRRGDYPRSVEMMDWALARWPRNDAFSIFASCAILAEATLHTGDHARTRAAITAFRESIERDGEFFRAVFGAESFADYTARVDQVEKALDEGGRRPLPGLVFVGEPAEPRRKVRHVPDRTGPFPAGDDPAGKGPFRASATG